MTTEELLTQVRQLDVRLWADGGRLRYSAAKCVLTEALKAALAERKADVLTFLQSATTVADGSRLSSIDHVSRDQPLPLSYAQQRLWFLDRLMPGSSFYN